MTQRYKIILSNTKETITIREEELQKVLKGISTGSPVVVREGILNPSYFVAIVPDQERMRAIAEAENYKSKLAEPSPFAKLINGRMTMLQSPPKPYPLPKVNKL